MSGREWAKLGLVVVCCNSWWAFAVLPKISFGDPLIQQPHPLPIIAGVLSGVVLVIWSLQGIVDQWDKE
jgi:hypothetical protein